eukprot:TRINITY_DN39174_c0_g1_i1.p1 TRINITY_DN39174_c0_g1~~TRINITY_DN39174_c0_g1_i1.p1  ORF type:complete len:590 (+),score=312.27 TRINITY_DN39174_c0_g1_i1:70-1839(+)
MAAPPQDPAAKRQRTDNGPAAPTLPQHTPGSESAWSEMARQSEWMQFQQQQQVEAAEAAAREAAAVEQQQRQAEAMERAAEAAKLQMEAKAQRKAEREARRKKEAEEERIRQIEQEADRREKAIQESKRQQEAAAAARKIERERRAKEVEMAEAPEPGTLEEEEVDMRTLKTKGQIYGHYLKLEKKKLKAEMELHKREAEKAAVINLDKLRFYSPNAAKAMEDEARKKQEIADEKARKRIAMAGRRQKLLEKRMKREQQAKEDHEKALKEIEEKQAEMQEQRVAALAEQLRLDHEARTRAEEKESKQMRKLKGSSAPKKDAPLRRVIRDEDKLRQLFTSITSLPAYGPRRAYCAGELCRVDDERGDGTVLLRFEDGFISWFPKRALIGFEDADMSENVLALVPSSATSRNQVAKVQDTSCDVCGKTCVPTPANRPRLCGDRETVYKIYVQMWEMGGLPAWNPRNVPNPRRAYCPGAECNVEEEDKAAEKVKLRFDDDFVSWFPAACLQGRKTQMEADRRANLPAVDKKIDPFGWAECVPDIEALTKRGEGLLTKGQLAGSFKMPKNPSQRDFAALAAASVPAMQIPGEV